MADIFNQKLCDERHNEITRRITLVEETIPKIMNKFEEVSNAMMKRLPIWVTVVISSLSSITTGLGVAFIVRK